jgi:hypothetical protein
MLLKPFIIVSAVLGLTIILLTLRAVRRGWSRDSERIRRLLEARRVLRRAERVSARVTQQVMAQTATADLAIALVLTDAALHVFRHVDGDLGRPANGAPFHVTLARDAGAAGQRLDRSRAFALGGDPVIDGAAVELPLAGAGPVTWRLTFADERDAREWFAAIDGILRAPEKIRAR